MPDTLKLSELIGSLSYALDLTEGQPVGHCVRSCWIGVHIGRHLGLADDALWELYYAILLKDLGCSSNAARISELYLADDRLFKQDFKLVGDSLPQMLGFLFSHTGRHAGWADRLRSILNVLRNGKKMADELIHTRCHRGADIARQLRFNENVARGIQSLDEHWDGSGRPLGAAGDAIPLNARIALLSQVIDVFHVTGGREAAVAETQRRAGGWFDPALVRTFAEGPARDEAFWRTLESDDIDAAVFALEPACHHMTVDEDYLDDIAEGFGLVVDSKSPFTAGHSQRVAHYADAIARDMGLDDSRRRWLRRGALLHDVGKLGVSNTILDKPGKLDPEEWVAVQRHAVHTREILSRIGLFHELADVSAAHHERLDGKGYPLGLSAPDIALETRIITTADIFDAINAERPYHPETPVPETLDIMRKNVGSAIDPDCLAALEGVLRREGLLD
ncbi:HD-GYP domain-containing protein [uncultured Aquitalea sp.]|uniref:HD-GYP domain-containing protein n=1 Tax=uncultured Aquitalea sp. TaxID=540272 RepID=UPI0025D0C19E|nr:HD-GYP domain-containing protein [uncultured Aquitalea sp.]